MKIKWIGLSILFLFLIIPAANADLISTFDDDREGWLAVDGGTLYYDSVGEYIWGKDVVGGPKFDFLSPWTGDLSSYIGGTLSYDAKLVSTQGGDFFTKYEVKITSGSNYATWDADVYPAISTWTTYGVDLDSSNFILSTGAVFEDIMAAVSSIKIRGEYTDHLYDSSALDNVRLSAVPEPTTMLLLGTGLIGLAGARRRMKK